MTGVFTLAIVADIDKSNGVNDNNRDGEDPRAMA
jgi:hypothetical protein